MHAHGWKCGQVDSGSQNHVRCVATVIEIFSQSGIEHVGVHELQPTDKMTLTLTASQVTNPNTWGASTPTSELEHSVTYDTPTL